MSALSITGLHKTFGATTALAGVDLAVEEGGTTALLGPSGCGKTTLLRIIAGFETPDSGEVFIDGDSVVGNGAAVRPEKRSIGYVSQEGALFPHLTVRQNIEFALGRGARRTGTRLQELCDLVSLDPGQTRRFPHELSGGQQQRVAIARALARRPRLVLLDEPFAALDASLRTSTRELVADALAGARVTTILVTHDQEEALSFADRVVVMQAGLVRQADEPQHLYNNPADEWVAGFVGEAVMVPADIRGSVATGELGPIRLSGPTVDGPARVVIRPEQILLTVEDSPTPEQIRGVVAAVSYRGHDQLVTVTVDSSLRRLVSRMPGLRNHFEPGTRVTVRIDGTCVAFPV